MYTHTHTHTHTHSQWSGGRSGETYLNTVSDTLLLREAGLTKPVGGVSSSKQYTGEELNENQVSVWVCLLLTNTKLHVHTYIFRSNTCYTILLGAKCGFAPS